MLEKKSKKISKSHKKGLFKSKSTGHSLSKNKNKRPAVASNSIMTFSPIFKGKDIDLLATNLEANGHKGYMSVLANLPIIEGAYYFEIKILEPKKPAPFKNVSPHVRVGIASKYFNNDMVLGCDKFSYSIRDTDGACFHNGSCTKIPAFSEGFTIGDTVGCLIFMNPPKPKSKIYLENDKTVPPSYDNRRLFEERNPRSDRERNSDRNLSESNSDRYCIEAQKSEVNVGSRLIFVKNGRVIGSAFEDLLQGFYFAGVSLYMNATVQANFGPVFEHPPNLSDYKNADIINYKPYSALVKEPQKYSDLDPF